MNFPAVLWGKTEVTFFADASAVLEQANIRAALIFAFYEEKFVVGNIAGRGWCIPGGHIEAGETLEQAIHRETYEEVGGILETARRVGYFRMANGPDNVHFIPAFVGRVARFEPLPAQTESLGVRLITREELPANYFIWDALMEAVFDYALTIRDVLAEQATETSR